MPHDLAPDEGSSGARRLDVATIVKIVVLVVTLAAAVAIWLPVYRTAVRRRHAEAVRAEELFRLRNPPFDADVLVEAWYGCMGVDANFELTIHRDRTATVKAFTGGTESWIVDQATLDAVVAAFLRRGFQGLRRDYDAIRGTDACHCGLMLNTAGVQRRVDADGSDPDSGAVFAIKDEVAAILRIYERVDRLNDERGMRTPSRPAPKSK